MQPETAHDVTDDAALGGRLKLLQPRRGHRFGHDAILLAAATPATAGDLVVDLGAGVGAAGLAVAARVAGVRLAFVELDPQLAELAARNAARNGCADAIVAALDVTAPEGEFLRAGVASGAADCVIMNPPFHNAATTNPSPDPARRIAHVGDGNILAVWVAVAARVLRAGGTLTVIYRADRMDDVLVALACDFGSVAVMPVHSRQDAPAIRILARAVKGGHDPLRLMPALDLNGADGRPSRQAEDVLRRAAALNLGS
jgi:tRNA1(Val) A37 N6-methylase TrmN6